MKTINVKPAGLMAVVSVAVVSTLLTGCGATQLGVVKQAFRQSNSCYVHKVEIKTYDDGGVLKTTEVPVAKDGNLNPDYLNALRQGDTNFDPFLACFFETDKGTTPLKEIDDAGDDGTNQNARLFRGYLALSMFATYGAFNLEVGEFDGRPNVAAGLLNRITEAQNLILLPAVANGANDSTVDVGAYLDRATEWSSEIKDDVAADKRIRLPVQRVHRVAQTLEVFAQAERPTLERAKAALLKIPNITSTTLESLAKSGVVGMKKSTDLRHLGRAYVRAYRAVLKKRQEAGWKVTLQNWQDVNRVVYQACDRIAVVAGIGEHRCKLKAPVPAAPSAGDGV